MEFVNRAYAYSARMHDGQRRKSGDPYFVHPVSVADIIADMRLDPASVCAALLHDVIEDTEATEEEVCAQFGKEVAFLVSGVTKLGKLNFDTREDRQVESFRKMLVAMSADIRVLLLKLADRLDNMRTLHFMSPDAQERISHETMEIYAPLAGRLGIQWLKNELEDLAFRYAYPDAFATVSDKIQGCARDSDLYIAEVTKQLETMLVERGFNAQVGGRAKHCFSIYRKMRANNCDFEQIHDLIAFRVTVENVSDCYAALGVVHSHWTPIPGRFKDYIALPKPNLYQSLHTTVIGPRHRRIEVQIRTVQMHRTAEHGIASHWLYKENAGTKNKDFETFAWLRRLMEFQNEIKDPDEFIDGVKIDLFADEVYVFTPKGDVKVFPRGATPVDFAYAIHTDIGDHCTGARVNGSIVPLAYKLHNGDTVDILTASKASPTRDWLGFVATARARSRVRAVVREHEHRRGHKLGCELLEREVSKRGLSFSRLCKGDALDRTLQHCSATTRDELFASVGYGRVSAKQIVDQLCALEGGDANGLQPGLIEKTVRKVVRRRKAPQPIVVSGFNDMLVRFGNCCKPLPGETSTGWITRGRGVTIHRKGCTRAMELDPERRVAVSWESQAKVDMPAALRVITSHQPGVLAHLATTFNEAGVNINEANSQSGRDGRAIHTFHFDVSDVRRLRGVIRRISKVNGVQEVQRI
ncbi:MAG: bifunctional (p)ppGpp synthetase/guanosine-3',5'-bis(diphosphate) 3'-pyrophosphohydrolase [Proteobacteria bacterium]|nr:bifunctional (p)ppGpp synthetase/guanosine-3',5'-bis(diphosphate) 3'-pyrophosphohydrolase [Pseudomonadota bacterium]